MYEQKTTWLLYYSITRRGRMKGYSTSVEASTHQQARKILLQKRKSGEIFRIESAECIVRVPEKK